MKPHHKFQLQIPMHPNREAFRGKSLVFISQPAPKWIRHDDCVWTAPAPLTQVIRLESSYSDCKNLFSDFLGVKSAGIRHVVEEFCSLSRGAWVDQADRFEELLTLLHGYLAKGLTLDVSETRSMNTARAFPVMKPGNLSHESATIVLRSLDDNDWYIPDKTTLELAFRGRVNLLKLSVRSVQLMMKVWVELGCKGLFLSSVVEEKVELGGVRIRNKSKEKELRTRLKYLAR